MGTELKISIAQLNPAVGDLKGNSEKIIRAWHTARKEDADLLMTTEFSLTGYPLEDLVEIRDFLDASKRTLDDLVHLTKNGGPGMLVGAPYFDGYDEETGRPQIYNASYMIENGKITDVVKKTHLPNYGVFDEKRNFVANPLKDVKPVEFRGYKLGVLVCEDTWFPDVAKKLADQGAEILLSVNASPFEQNKFDKRVDQIVTSRVQETGLDLIYANQVGGQDELIFDGASFALSLNDSGQLRKVFQAATLREDQVTLTACKNGHRLQIIEDAQNIKPRPDAREELYTALVMGTRDYVHKSGFKDVVMGLSGGIDSGLVAAIAVDALGAENVHLVRLPSKYTSDMSNNDADIQADFLGVKDIREIGIKDSVLAAENALAQSFAGQPPDVTEENIQSRMRGLLLMALSNKFGWMLLSTGNKSEMSVGYCTLYGDTNGGFNPIKDVYKTTVRELSQWRNENAPEGMKGPQKAKFDADAGKDAMVMPWNIITRPPSAELREDQEDSHTLPDYDILDDILARRIEGAQSRDEIIAAGYEEDVIDRILTLMKIAVYKQNQTPPGVKTTARAVRGRDLRLPIANRFNPARGGQ